MSTQTNLLLIEMKYKFHQWLSLATGLITLFFCFFNTIMLHQLTIGAIQAVIGSLNLYFFRSSRQKKIHKWHLYMLMMTITISSLYAFYSADLRAGSAYWLILLPPIYCILAGTKIGITYTIILSFPTIAILFIKSDTDANIPYRSVINFTLAYFLAYAICYFHSMQYAKNSLLLHQMAFKDSLTGAQNRHALKLFFDDFNKQEGAAIKSQSLRLVVIDIDYFKSVNDRFGHDVGDIVLIETADLLQSLSDDNHVYRIGGEEFLIIHNEGTCSQTFEFAEMIRKRIEGNVFRSHEHKIKLTVSIGIAQLNRGKTFQDFLQEADQNLYSAKSKGRNRVYHSSLE